MILTPQCIRLTWAIVPVANVSGLNPIIAKLLDNIIIPSLNKLLNKGLPLPIIGGIEFVNTEVIYNPEGIVTLLAGFQPVSIIFMEADKSKRETQPK